MATTSKPTFGAEMDAQAQAQVDALYFSVYGQARPATQGAAGSAGRGGLSAGAAASAAEEYDPAYFDSDEEVTFDDDDDEAQAGEAAGREAGASGPKSKAAKGRVAAAQSSKRKLTDDELLYDPEMDDADEEWVTKQRNQHLPPDLLLRANGTAKGAAKARNYSAGLEPLPDSDAILNCPACMTTLCLDCQRHERYPHQYRAMFVMNVQVDQSKVYEFKELPHSRGQQRRQQRKQAAEEKRRRTEEEQQEARQNAWDDDEDDDVDGEVGADDDGAAQDGDGEPGMAPSAASSATKPEDQFNPCYCTECNTLVAMYDIDEVYHFFNVIDSDA